MLVINAQLEPVIESDEVFESLFDPPAKESMSWSEQVLLLLLVKEHGATAARRSCASVRKHGSGSCGGGASGASGASVK